MGTESEEIATRSRSFFARRSVQARQESLENLPEDAPSITIVGAENLRVADKSVGSSDPYCVFWVQNKKSTTKQQTLTVHRSLCPTWNFSKRFPKSISGAALDFEVWDKDYLSPDDILGRATLRLGPLVSNPEQVFTQELLLTLPEGSTHDTETLGTIKVQLKGVRPAFDMTRNERRAQLSRPPAPQHSRGSLSSGHNEHAEGGARMLARPDPVADGNSGVHQGMDVPEDQLMRGDPQNWALFFLVMSLVLAVYSTGIPLSCVEPPQEMPKFSACKGLRLERNTTDLRLPQFCWTPCTESNLQFLLLMIGIAILGQAFVVVLNLGKFSSFFRWTFYFDLWDFLQEAESRTKPGQVEADLREMSVQGSFLQRNVFRLIRRPLAQKIDIAVEQARDHVGTNVNLQRTSQSSARQASQLIKAVTGVSVLHVGFLIYSGFSVSDSSFSCEGIHEVVMSPKQEIPSLAGVVACEACLMLALVLVNNAQWAIHLRVRPAHNLETGQRAAQRLREHFREVPAYEVGDDEMDESQENQPLKTTRSEKPTEYIPRLQGCYPEEDFCNLVMVENLNLAGIRYRGILYQLEDVKRVLKEEKVPRHSKDEVVLLFRPRNHLTLEAMVMDYFFFDTHRFCGILLLGLAAGGMALAHSSCWTCVRAINVLEGENITGSELADRLGLFGACGSYGGIGNATFLGCVATIVAALQQVVILHISKERKAQGGSPEDEEQLRLTVLDFRKNANLDISKYEKGYVDDEEDDDMPAFVMCYVWVKKRFDDADEEVMDARRLGSDGDIRLRRHWQRSSKPRKVRLVKKSDPTRAHMSKGLSRPSHGAPSICVEVLKEDGDRVSPRVALEEEEQQQQPGLDRDATSRYQGGGCQQIVPVEFIAGFFHLELNLGPTVAWESMSVCLMLVAIFLTCVDLGMFFFGPESSSLSTCKDIKNGITCSKFSLTDQDQRSSWFWGSRHHEEKRPIAFRASLAPMVALVSVLCGLLGMTAVRVAGKLQGKARPFCGSVLYMYFQAICEGLTLVVHILKWSCHSCLDCIRNTRCWRIRALEDNNNEPDDHYSYLDNNIELLGRQPST